MKTRSRQGLNMSLTKSKINFLKRFLKRIVSLKVPPSNKTTKSSMWCILIELKTIAKLFKCTIIKTKWACKTNKLTKNHSFKTTCFKKRIILRIILYKRLNFITKKTMCQSILRTLMKIIGILQPPTKFKCSTPIWLLQILSIKIKESNRLQMAQKITDAWTIKTTSRKSKTNIIKRKSRLSWEGLKITQIWAKTHLKSCYINSKRLGQHRFFI
jgi:hypothetical protein